jgi:hypothetical protein
MSALKSGSTDFPSLGLGPVREPATSDATDTIIAAEYLRDFGLGPDATRLEAEWEQLEEYYAKMLEAMENRSNYEAARQLLLQVLNQALVLKVLLNELIGTVEAMSPSAAKTGKSDDASAVPPPAAAHEPDPERPSKEALALAVLADHPDWPDTEIAKKAGCNRTTLYTFKKFMAAKKILRAGRSNLPQGSKFPNEGMEAWDNEGDG